MYSFIKTKISLLKSQKLRSVTFYEVKKWDTKPSANRRIAVIILNTMDNRGILHSQQTEY